MKVAFILSRCSNLGPFIVARDIANNICDKVDTVDIFYLKETNEKLSFKASCEKISFFERIDFSNYDIVHSHGFIADTYVFFHKRKASCKYVTTLHQRIAPDYAMKYNWLIGVLFERIWCGVLKNRSHVITLTRELASYYKKRLKRNDIEFIYNGIEILSESEKIFDYDLKKIMALKEKYKIIGISARLIYLKGIDQVIRSLPHINEFALIILGDGEERKELELLSKELNVDCRCLFLGYKKNALSYFKYFDLYAMSSRSEGFGLCVIEAASQKVPIVCADLPVYREIFNEDEVIRFELENISSLIQAFQEAIAKQESLSIKVYKKYKDNFTASIMANNYLNIYRS